MATKPMPDAEPTCYLLIDGDGHHEISEDELRDKLLDLIVSNAETSFKTTRHTIVGVPFIVIEAI